MLDSLYLLAAATAEAGAETSLVGQFGIDYKLILAQALNFAIVAFLLWRFAFKPVLATMDDRQKKIAEGLQFAEESRAQLAETEKKQAEVLREANAQAKDILHQARENATRFEEKMKTETAGQIEEMRRRAEEANELERQKILAEVRQEIARLVVLTAGKVLQRELGDDEKSRLDQSAAQEMTKLN